MVQTDSTVTTSPPVETSTPPATPPQKPRKRGCGCLVPLLLLVGIVGFAPQILTMTALRNQVPALVISGLPPGVVIGSASAGWVSPIQLNDVMIPDDQGRPNLKLKHVTLSRSIWELATGTEDLGTVVIEKPDLRLIVENGVSNYDRTIQRLTGKPGRGKRKLLDLKLTEGVIQITEGSLTSPVSRKSPEDPNRIPDTPSSPPEEKESDKVATPDSEQPAVVPERPVAIIDLKSATFLSQAVGDEELRAEITATLREPAVEQPLTAELHWNLPDGDAAGVGSGRLIAAIPSLPLEILSPWLAPLASGRDVSGAAALQINLEALPTEKELLLGARVEIPQIDLRLAPDQTHPQPFRWSGQNLRLVAEGQGDLQGQKVQLQSAQLRTPLINADFSGTLLDLPGAMNCNLSGTCNLNPQDLLGALPPEWSEHVQIQGVTLGEIRVQGDLRTGHLTPANPETATAQPLHLAAEVSWETGNVMGFRSDNAQVSIHWTGQTLSLNPNRLPISGGQWVASPRIEFAPEGRTLVFDGGPVFENVQFTKEMSDTWLKYISPILGQATNIEGQFSLSAAPARVGLRAPWPGEVTGDLDILGAQVSSGPMTRPILESVAAIQSMVGRKPVSADELMQVEAQRVRFQFAEGRVSHQGLHVSMGDLLVNSEGSVGLDETLDLLFTVPIPDKWTQGKPLLAGLKGEKVPFPMGGTLDQPALNHQALSDFGKRIGMKSAGGLIEQLIQRRQEKKANGELPSQQPRPRPPRK